jgi:hypothetical protein
MDSVVTLKGLTQLGHGESCIHSQLQSMYRSFMMIVHYDHVFEHLFFRATATSFHQGVSECAPVFEQTSFAI